MTFILLQYLLFIGHSLELRSLKVQATLLYEQKDAELLGNKVRIIV